jgi:hypothetical protein
LAEQGRRRGGGQIVLPIETAIDDQQLTFFEALSTGGRNHAFPPLLDEQGLISRQQVDGRNRLR